MPFFSVQIYEGTSQIQRIVISRILSDAMKARVWARTDIEPAIFILLIWYRFYIAQLLQW